MAGTRNYDFLVRFSVPPTCDRFESRLARALLTDIFLFTDKAAPDRRLGRREIMLSASVQRGLLHTLLHHNDRHRLQDPDH